MTDERIYLLLNAGREVEFREDLSSFSILKADREQSHILSWVQSSVLAETRGKSEAKALSQYIS